MKIGEIKQIIETAKLINIKDIKCNDKVRENNLKTIYQFIQKLAELYLEVIERLRKLINKIFVQERLLVSFTAEKEAFDKATPAMAKFIQALPKGTKAACIAKDVLGQQNEGFTDASAIQYVSRSGNFVNHGFKYTGALNILKMILSYDYLWNNVRVKGGAYGCSSSFLRTGDSYFTSYRDPNLGKTKT